LQPSQEDAKLLAEPAQGGRIGDGSSRRRPRNKLARLIVPTLADPFESPLPTGDNPIFGGLALMWIKLRFSGHIAFFD
jgi:hypothetical protein